MTDVIKKVCIATVLALSLTVGLLSGMWNTAQASEAESTPATEEVVDRVAWHSATLLDTYKSFVCDLLTYPQYDETYRTVYYESRWNRIDHVIWVDHGWGPNGVGRLWGEITQYWCEYETD